MRHINYLLTYLCVQLFITKAFYNVNLTAFNKKT